MNKALRGGGTIDVSFDLRQCIKSPLGAEFGHPNIQDVFYLETKSKIEEKRRRRKKSETNPSGAQSLDRVSTS